MRSQRILEDADDGAELLAADGSPWTCSICGEWERNMDGWPGASCYFCQEIRGSWQCVCGLINPPESKSCQNCGRSHDV